MFDAVAYMLRLAHQDQCERCAIRYDDTCPDLLAREVFWPDDDV
jgi:hypothetical protein